MLDNFVKAKELIEKYGWVQEDFGCKEKGFCLVGAVMEVYPGQTMPMDIIHTLYKAVGGRNLVCWNDKPGRTKEEVLALLDKAINMLEDNNAQSS